MTPWHCFSVEKKNSDPKSPWMFIVRVDIFSCGFNSPQNVAPVSLRKVSFRMKRVDFFFNQNVSIFVAESGPQIFLGTMNETLWFFHWIWPLTFFKPFTVWNLLAAERWKPMFQTVCFRCDPVLLTPRFSTKTTKKKSHEKKCIKHHSSRYITILSSGDPT